MKIHITGADGFLGSYVRQVMEADHELELSDVASLDVPNFNVPNNVNTGRKRSRKRSIAIYRQ